MTTTQDSTRPRDRPFEPFRITGTDTAATLVADVLNQLQNYEDHSKLRKRARRKDDQRTFERIVETVVCDLVHLELTQPGGWAAIPLSKQVLSSKDRYRSPVLSKALPDVVKRMASPEMGFVEFVKGRHVHSTNRDEPNRQSVIRAGHRLRTRIQDNKLRLSDLVLDKYEEVIILRTKDEATKKSISLPYQDSAVTCMYREQVRRINDWLEKADIEFDLRDHAGPAVDISRRLVRIFNNGSFEQGGRLYGGFWIPLQQHQRLSGIIINGAPVVSLDFGQMAARILYGMAGVEPHFEDAYTLPGWEKYRGTVKTVFNAMLHASSRHTRFPKGSRQQLHQGVKVDEAINAITEFHTPIKAHFYSGHGMKVMFKESQIMVDILLRLIDEGIVALPIHDALIVSEDDIHQAKRTMLEAFHGHTGVRGLVEVEYRD